LKAEAKKVLQKTDTKALLNLIIDSIDDKKAEGITSIDLREITEAIADYFVVCHADNMPQVRAIAENVMYRLKTEMNEVAFHSEGLNNLEWVLIDYFDIVVHVFYKEKREFYNIEELWSDGKITEH